MISKICSLKEAEPFLEPVPYEALGILDYPKIVKKMMDFNTIKENIRDHQYKSVKEVLDDIQLIWDNCKLYNLEYSKIHKIAIILEGKLKKEVHKNFGEIDYGKNNPSYTELVNQKNRKFYEDEINYREKMEIIEIVKELSPRELTKMVDLLRTNCPRALKDSDDSN